LKNEIVVIGVGNAQYGNVFHIDDYGLAAPAFSNVVADLGIDRTTSKGFSSATSRIARGWAQSLGSARAGRDPARSLPHVGNGNHRGIGL
jgi:hypothetical protein